MKNNGREQVFACFLNLGPLDWSNRTETLSSIIWSSVLYFNTSDVMHAIMKLVNCLLWTSAFQHHLLCSFLDGVSADYDDLQLHCDVYGLNKEKVLKRLWALKKEIQPFLQEHRAEQTKHFWNFLPATNGWWFPIDILTHFIPSTKVFRAWIKFSDI